jgi:hypothetical protein
MFQPSQDFDQYNTTLYDHRFDLDLEHVVAHSAPELYIVTLTQVQNYNEHIRSADFRGMNRGFLGKELCSAVPGIKTQLGWLETWQQMDA